MRAGALAGCLLALSLTTLPPGRARADDAAEPAVQTRVAVPSEAGRWRTRSQSVFDPFARELVRRTVTVWDPRPSLDRDFSWLPDGPATAAGPERVTGTGRLVWRDPGRPAYDPRSVQAEYRGAMRDGRPDGAGTHTERGGLTYEGAWRAGRPEGAGTLRLGNGAEYQGGFAAGLAHGPGRFFDVDGERFEGSFRDGFRDGKGRTILPGGGAYLSEWVRGEEVANSRRLRLAQLGPARGPADDVRLGVTVDRVDDPDLLQYSSAQSESGLVIQPSRRRLMEAWKGNGSIQLLPKEEEPGTRGSYGLFAFSAADLPAPTLVFEVQNRSAAPVRVRGAYLDVETSASDLQPAIQLTTGSSGECSARPRNDFAPSFELENFGWGPAEGATLRFALTHPRSNPAAGALNVTREVGTVRNAAKVDLEAELRAAGVKVDELKKRAEKGGLACRAKGNAAACLAEIAGSGLFGSLSKSLALEERDVVVAATGTLSYAWKSVAGAESARTSPFSARLLLGRTPTESECGEGGEKEPIAPKPLELRLDQSGYRIPVAFERSIPAGRTSRYTLALKAPRSSEHRFKVVLQMADGRLVTSRPIRLTYFLPSRLIDLNVNQ